MSVAIKCWYKYQWTLDGFVQYEFYRGNDKVNEGITTPSQVVLRFQLLDASAQLPLH